MTGLFILRSRFVGEASYTKADLTSTGAPTAEGFKYFIDFLADAQC
ncbi:MAG: hypothetical protein RLZZ499_1515 [Cyanobacteriota bacterium]|jgi:hypothetical protein